MRDNIFEKIEQQSGVDKQQIFNLANSVKDADFSNDEVVRNLVRQVASAAGRPVSHDKEEQIVRAITSNNIPLDFTGLNNLFKK